MQWLFHLQHEIIMVALNHTPGLEPTVSPFPTLSPSVSPSFAPTTLVDVTAVLQLDGNPSETSWSLRCGGRVLFDIPAGTYVTRENRTITLNVQPGTGECEITVE